MDTYRATYNGEVIAQCSEVVLLEGTSTSTIRSTARIPAAHPRQVAVHWKGRASYYTVQVNGPTDRNAAWTYRHPSSLARRIKDHVAFWRGVQVERVTALTTDDSGLR
jgi:uncharacterized protein (DUF427 family)